MALTLVRPINEISDIGTDDFIRGIRELWIKYADPKYIDIIDTDHVPTPEELRINPELGITLPEIISFGEDAGGDVSQ